MSANFKMRGEHYIAKRYANRQEWLKGRFESVGASEVAMVLGVSPRSWGDANSLWERKRNPTTDEGGNEDTERGASAEEHIRELLGIENRDIKVVDMTGIVFRSRKYPWLTCSLDAIILYPDGSFTVVEIKDVRYTPHWKNGNYPLYYKIQCTAQMLVTGAKDAVLLARINYDFGTGKTRLERLCNSSVTEKRFLIKRSEVKGQFAGIIRETKEFWEAVKNGTPPVVRIR